MNIWEAMYKERIVPEMKVEVLKAIAKKHSGSDLNTMWVNTLGDSYRIYASLWMQQLKDLQKEVESVHKIRDHFIEFTDVLKIRLLESYEGQIVKICEADRGKARGIVRARLDMMHFEVLKFFKDLLKKKRTSENSLVNYIMFSIYGTTMHIHKRLMKYEELGWSRVSEDEWVKQDNLFRQLLLHEKMDEFMKRLTHKKTEDELCRIPAKEVIQIMESVLGHSS